MKKFLISVLSFFALIAIGIGIFFLTFDLNTYRGTIEEKLSAILGRPVTIGDLETKLAWIPTIKARNIEVKNAKGFLADEPLARIDSAEVTLAVAPLFDKRAEILDVSLGNVEIFLKRKGGHGNWEFNETSGRPATVSAKNKWKTRVDSIFAKSVQINYSDGAESWKRSVSQFSLKQLKVFSFTFDIAQNPFKVSGTMDDLLELANHKPDYLFNFDVTGSGTTAKISGSIGDTQSFNDVLLNIEISGTGLRKSMQQIGVKSDLFPALPFKLMTVWQGNLRDVQLKQTELSLDGTKLKAIFEGECLDVAGEPKLEMTGQIALADVALAQMWGIRPFTSDVIIEATPQQVDIKQLNYRAGRSDIQVLGRLVLDGKPNLNVTVSSEYLDVLDLFPESSAEYDVGTHQAKRIENKPIDFSPLNLFDGVITLKMPHIKIGESVTEYIGVDSRVEINDGILSTEGTQIKFLKGLILVNAAASAQDKQSLFVKAKGENLSLDAIKAFKDTIRDGLVDVAVDLETKGKSVYEIFDNLSGNVQIEVIQGTIIHSWFNETVDLLKTHKKKSFSYSTTDKLNQIVCGAMDLDIHDGKMVSDDSIVIESSDIAFRASGRVDLLTGNLNVNIWPLLYQPQIETMKDIVKNPATILAAVAQLIQLTGPIQDPQFQLGERVNLSKDALSYTEQYHLCAGVLKRDPKGYVLSESKKHMMLPKVEKTEEVEEPQSKQDKFRKQLLETLSKATQE